MAAVAIPNFELFVSLYGAFCLSVLGLAFPALIEYCTFHKTVFGWEKVAMVVKDSVIAIIALAGLTIGTYTSVMEIVRIYFLDNNQH